MLCSYKSIIELYLTPIEREGHQIMDLLCDSKPCGKCTLLVLGCLAAWHPNGETMVIII